MLNKEKYAKEILNIACEGHSIAMIDGKLRQCSGASCSKCDFNSNINCRKNVNEWANSEYINRLNHLLIGVRFQLIRRLWLGQPTKALGFIDILQNTKMDQCMHGNRVQHLGVLKDRHMYAIGNMPNWQKVRIIMSISRIKNRISEAATEACGYSPLTKVVSEEEINRILEQESGWIPVDEQIPNTDKYILVSFETLLFQISEDMKLMKMVTVRFIRGMMTKAMQNMDYL